MYKMLSFIAASGAVVLAGIILMRTVAAIDASPPRGGAQSTPSMTAEAPETDAPTATWASYRFSGVSLLAPAGLAATESETTIRLSDRPATATHVTVLSLPDGRPIISIARVGNPQQLNLSDWIAAVPGWPGAAEEINVGGRQGLLFETDQAGDRNPTLYVADKDSVIAIRAATDLRTTAPGITRDQFQQVLEGVNYDQ